MENSSFGLFPPETYKIVTESWTSREDDKSSSFTVNALVRFFLYSSVVDVLKQHTTPYLTTNENMYTFR